MNFINEIKVDLNIVVCLDKTHGRVRNASNINDQLTMKRLMIRLYVNDGPLKLETAKIFLDLHHSRGIQPLLVNFVIYTLEFLYIRKAKITISNESVEYMKWRLMKHHENPHRCHMVDLYVCVIGMSELTCEVRSLQTLCRFSIVNNITDYRTLHQPELLGLNESASELLFGDSFLLKSVSDSKAKQKPEENNTFAEVVLNELEEHAEEEHEPEEGYCQFCNISLKDIREYELPSDLYSDIKVFSSSVIFSVDVGRPVSYMESDTSEISVGGMIVDHFRKLDKCLRGQLYQVISEHGSRFSSHQLWDTIYLQSHIQSCRKDTCHSFHSEPMYVSKLKPVIEKVPYPEFRYSSYYDYDYEENNQADERRVCQCLMWMWDVQNIIKEHWGIVDIH